MSRGADENPTFSSAGACPAPDLAPTERGTSPRATLFGRAPGGALVIGASGLLGGRLMHALEEQGYEPVGTYWTRPAPELHFLDLRDDLAVQRIVEAHAPAIVFLAGGLTSVDRAEQQPDTAFALNVDGTRAVARAASAAGAKLVFYSTDYIFDGTNGPYDEDAPPCPLNVYGRTKAAAEEAIRQSGCDHLIVRTSALYGWSRGSTNLAMQVWERVAAGETLPAPGDQITNPTLADYLAEVSLRLVQDGVCGVVNVVGRDRLSGAAFAQAVARALALDPALILPSPTLSLGQAAPRPLIGGLRTERLQRLLGTEPMALDEALKRLRRRWRADTYVAAGPRATGSEAERLRNEILGQVRRYFTLAHQPPPFVPFETRIPYSGRVYGHEEIVNVVDAALDFWLTLGPYGDLFEQNLRRFLGCRDAVLVNSGSSANLTALATLMAPQVEGRLKPGDEVITPAVTFPTTLAPIVHLGLIPVFVDCELGTYNIDPSGVEEAISPSTRALFIPHTLGNPCDLEVLCEVARRYSLFFIEDSCDALGATFDGKPVGTFGDLASLSFYPAHQMTMGEGGAVIVNQGRYSRVVRSVRDWGRDCWCAPGESNTCGRRFGWCLGSLPAGYDHKYIYSTVGFNLKPTDLQAAIGVAQIDRLPEFVQKRRANFATLYEGLRPLEEHLLLPRWSPRAEPSWFGFPVTVREGVSRRALVQWLEDANIETRDVFGGNILHQPGYRDIRRRVVGTLDNSDRIMESTFFVGVYPGLSPDMLAFMIDRFVAYFRRGASNRS